MNTTAKCKNCKYFTEIDTDKPIKLEKRQFLVNHGNMFMDNSGTYVTGHAEYCGYDGAIIGLQISFNGTVTECGCYKEKKE